MIAQSMGWFGLIEILDLFPKKSVVYKLDLLNTDSFFQKVH